MSEESVSQSAATARRMGFDPMTAAVFLAQTMPGSKFAQVYTKAVLTNEFISAATGGMDIRNIVDHFRSDAGKEQLRDTGDKAKQLAHQGSSFIAEQTKKVLKFVEEKGLNSGNMHEIAGNLSQHSKELASLITGNQISGHVGAKLQQVQKFLSRK
jgi:hypothetical protein